MKIKFKHFAIVALAFSVGLASCTKKNGESPVPESKTKTVSVSVDVKGANSRAVGSETASGVTPTLSDVKLFFVGADYIQQIETISEAADITAINNAAGSKFTVPVATTKVYVIGNAGKLSSPALPKVGDPESALQSVMLEVDKQTSPKDVNLSHGQGVTTGVTFAENKATITLMPAVARYEIKKVSAKDSAVQPLKEFKLSAIYITNTYRTLALNYATVPTGADVINAGPDSDLTQALIMPSYLKDLVNATEVGTSFTPSGGNYWSYFLNAPVANKGTTLVGSTTQESSVPIIILEIKDAVAKSGTLTYPTTSYVNVRKLIQKSDSKLITALEPGKVYIIEDIAFGGEHLTAKPGEVHDREVTVTVTVQKWDGVPVTPGL